MAAICRRVDAVRMQASAVIWNVHSHDMHGMIRIRVDVPHSRATETSSLRRKAAAERICGMHGDGIRRRRSLHEGHMRVRKEIQWQKPDTCAAAVVRFDESEVPRAIACSARQGFRVVRRPGLGFAKGRESRPLVRATNHSIENLLIARLRMERRRRVGQMACPRRHQCHTTGRVIGHENSRVQRTGRRRRAEATVARRRQIVA